jgi:sec-independent protein translocase protein TatA
MKLLEPQGLIIILVIVLIVFGPKRLPELGKSLGKTIKGFREATEGKMDAEESDAVAKD